MDNSSKLYDGTRLEHLTFSLYDYLFFFAMLVVSALIGIYFGVIKKQNTANDYLMGGKNMGVIPIAVSLAVSYISATTMLGMPAEVYMYGTQYFASCLGGIFATIIIGIVFLPVFYDLQLTSSYEYLELRFCRKVRLTASFLFIFKSAMTIPIVMYVPALAFNLVTGVNIKIITPLVCFVCIFYTTLGGLKAVVWTDTIQFLTMNGAIFVIMLIGISNEGGISAIWKIAEEEDRLHFFDLDIDPTTRITFWTATVGMCFGWVSSLGVNQLCIQRFLSVPTLADAHKVLYAYGVVIAIIKGFCLLSGLIMLSRYYGCDPVTAGIISRADQILPYYVMDTTRHVPGLPGLFIAGVFSASLSSMSSYLNTVSGVIYKDFICQYIPNASSEAHANTIMRVIAVVFGTISVSMVFIVEKLGSVIQMAISFSGLTNGAMLGTFIMGMMFSRANSKGTVTGAIVSVSFMVWILYGNTMAQRNGLLVYPTKHFSMEECNSTYVNSSIISKIHNTTATDEVFYLHRVSFMWYSFIGTLTMLAVALPVSYLTRPPLPSQTRLEYFSPVVRRFLPREIREQTREARNTEHQYNKVDIVLQTMNSKN